MWVSLAQEGIHDTEAPKRRPAAVLAADGELDPISCGLGDAGIAFVYQADLETEGTNTRIFVRLTSHGTTDEPVIEKTPVEVASAR